MKIVFLVEMSNETLIEKVISIKRQFVCCVPLEILAINDVFKPEDQEFLLSETVNCPLVVKYPVKYSYQRKFLKIIIEHLESDGNEIIDGLYEAFGRLMGLPDEGQIFYKHYISDLGLTISLCEEVSFISGGTTGLCTWTAALALTDWCLDNSSILLDRIVLELGSGVGLAGLAIAKHCKPNKIYLTDCHPTVLARLGNNIKLNQSQSKSENSLVEIEALNLAWEAVTVDVCQKLNADIILAADIVYDPDLFEPLLKALQSFLCYKKACKRVAYIVCTERNRNTLEEFLALIGSFGLDYVELPKLKPSHFIWSDDVPVRLFKLTAI